MTPDCGSSDIAPRTEEFISPDKQQAIKSEWVFGFAEDDTEMEDEDHTFYKADGTKDPTAMSVFDFASMAPTPTAIRSPHLPFAQLSLPGLMQQERSVEDSE